MKKLSKERKKDLYKRLRYACILSLVLIIGTTGILIFTHFMQHQSSKGLSLNTKNTVSKDGRIIEHLLDKNPYSRPMIYRKEIKGVVVHYTANPGTDAEANRNYFNNLPSINKKNGTSIHASSHYIIGIDGTIIRCIPDGEIAYASNQRNTDTIAIECCHKAASGEFTKETLQSLIWLVAKLCKEYSLDQSEIIRHYDITGKLCPKYFVVHEDAWVALKNEVMKEVRR